MASSSSLGVASSLAQVTTARLPPMPHIFTPFLILMKPSSPQFLPLIDT